MRHKFLDTNLAMTMAWMWLSIVVAAVVGYGLFRWWRKRHPLPVPTDEPPYAQRLQHRLEELRAAGKPPKRSKPVRKHSRGP